MDIHGLIFRSQDVPGSSKATKNTMKITENSLRQAVIRRVFSTGWAVLFLGVKGVSDVSGNSAVKGHAMKDQHRSGIERSVSIPH